MGNPADSETLVQTGALPATAVRASGAMRGPCRFTQSGKTQDGTEWHDANARAVDGHCRRFDSKAPTGGAIQP